jgi:hypothetical protein
MSLRCAIIELPGNTEMLVHVLHALIRNRGDVVEMKFETHVRTVGMFMALSILISGSPLMGRRSTDIFRFRHDLPPRSIWFYIAPAPESSSEGRRASRLSVDNQLNGVSSRSSHDGCVIRFFGGLAKSPHEGDI